jgi:hypothetical protein
MPLKPLGAVNQQPIDLSTSISPAQDTADEIQLTEVIDITDEMLSSLQSKKEVTSEVKEEEWPSIGVEELKEEAVSEVKEEEWPSIGVEELKEEINIAVQDADVAHDQSVNGTELPEQKADSDDGSLSIPGLKSVSAPPPKRQSSKTLPSESSLPSDSLGELRFSDDD